MGARDKGALTAAIASLRAMVAGWLRPFSTPPRGCSKPSPRWFLWLPVLFAGGIIAYFALANEPAARLAAALVLGTVGLCLALRKAHLGLAIGGALLALALGFATAKLRTEMTRAPVLASELRYVTVTGFVEEHEGRGKNRARIVLRVLSLGNLAPDRRPCRVRIGVSAKEGAKARTGEPVTLRATLRPPPEPIEPGGFDFARQAWFARLGATGYATSRIRPLEDAPEPPWDLRAWGTVDALRAEVNAADQDGAAQGKRRHRHRPDDRRARRCSRGGETGHA